MEWVAMGPHHPTSIVFHPHLSQKITRISWTSGARESCLDQSWSRDGGRTLPRDGAWHQIKKQISKPLRTGGQGNRCSRRTGPCLVGIAVLMVQETRIHRKELRLHLADDSNLCLLSTETLEEKKPSLFASLLKESEELTHAASNLISQDGPKTHSWLCHPRGSHESNTVWHLMAETAPRAGTHHSS